jgi:hypothetical protein
MGVKVELRVLELLASRVCHDLISPIGAVGNGLEPTPAGLNVPPAAPKLALNLVLLGTEMLPRGGEIAIGLQGAGNRVIVSAVATGRDARLPDEMAAAIAAAADAPPALSARTVHGFFAARLAEAAGGRLEVAAQPSAVRLSASLPAA